MNVDEILFDYLSSQEIEDETVEYDSDSISEMLFDNEYDETDEMLISGPILRTPRTDKDLSTASEADRRSYSRAPDRLC